MSSPAAADARLLKDIEERNDMPHRMMLSILFRVIMKYEQDSERMNRGCDHQGRAGVQRAPNLAQHFLNFLPLPHGQGSLRPTRMPLRAESPSCGAV